MDTTRQLTVVFWHPVYLVPSPSIVSLIATYPNTFPVLLRNKRILYSYNQPDSLVDLAFEILRTPIPVLFPCSVKAHLWNRKLSKLVHTFNILTTLISRQHPQQQGFFFFLYIRFLAYLKYPDSNPSNANAIRIPNINKTKADKNCSIAKGSLDLCWCFPGLHDPVIQYLLNLSKSPTKRTTWNTCHLHCKITTVGSNFINTTRKTEKKKSFLN